MRRFILVPHLKIHNANAMSSPYSIGFPAMTAWLGAVHALQRKLQQQGFSDLFLNKVAISSHAFNLQTYKGKGDYVHSIVGTANPLDKNGDRPAFIEEARCHLEVSLLIEYSGEYSEQVAQAITTQLHSMKVASGDVLGFKALQHLTLEDGNEQDLKMILGRLMLGHVLIERRDLIQQAMQQRQNGQEGQGDQQQAGQDALDALLGYLTVNHTATEQDGKVSWSSNRKTKGWLVPVAVGFQGIFELGIAQNQRDNTTPHRFAESVLTLGEFVMPYRIKDIDSMLWHYHIPEAHGDAPASLYLCKTSPQEVTELFFETQTTETPTI